MRRSTAFWLAVSVLTWSAVLVRELVRPDKAPVQAPPAIEERAPGDSQPVAINTPVYFWIDSDTGCHYIVSRSWAITPRLTGEGKQLCTK